jgi:peptidylprolyl isomerase
MRRTLLLALALTSTLTACGGGSNDKITVQGPSPTPTPVTACTPASSPSKDLKVKPTYVPSNCPPPATTTNTDIVVGTQGPAAKDGSAVTVQYVGVNYATGEQFDASWDSGSTFPFTIGSGVIPGFSKGVTGMKVGGRRLVVIPPAEGYGNSGPVPGGTLAFIIDLVKIG